ncbi:MAG: DEAD/DEAH box helicase [Planctomycetes bacterium]|nr:DEAD/DEAH box helicase [Planctomycetota bacterium]
MPFTKFGLSDPLVRGILATGYTAPTEIQSQAIPAAVEGRDVIGCAQTGTGKTAAFVLPILDRLSHETPSKKRIVKALILTPTRELALQIETAIKGYGRFVDIRTLAVYGGVNIRGQLNSLKRGVDIVVATPGRLMDHMERGTIDLKHIEVLVLDEADRMLDMGFINDVKKIVRALPAKKRQTMLFSATISKEVKNLAAEMQKSPKMIQIGRPRNPIETITQHIYPVRKEQKMDLLIHLLGASQMYSVLVFSRTKRGADKISRRLKRAGVVSVAIHSGRTQGQRLQAMDGFKRGKFQVMVATDIAARGINIEGISHVINYDVPAYAEDYVHRIGRTGRATALGDAITFVSYDEQKYLRKIENFIGRELKTEKCEGFAYAKSNSLQPQPAEKSKSKPVRHTSTRRTPSRKPRASRRPRRKAAKRRVT